MSGSALTNDVIRVAASSASEIALTVSRADPHLLIWAGLFAIGVGLLLQELVRVRSRPPLREELSRQDVERRLRETLEDRALASPGRRWASTDARASERNLLPPVVKRMLGPVFADLGWLVRGIMARFAPGLAQDSSLERDLHLVRPGASPGGFLGEKIGAGLLWLGILPALAALGGPRTPPIVWLAAGAIGFLLPDLDLKRRLAARQALMIAELPVVLDQLVIATSAGLSLEQGIEQTAASGAGTVADELRRLVTELGIGRWRSLQEGLEGLDRRNAVPELSALIGQLRAASQQGVPVGQVLAAQADSLRDRRKAALVAAGGRATVRMVIPIGIFILPVLAVVVLVPAAVQLLQLRS
jgi:tight adherence protein C